MTEANPGVHFLTFPFTLAQADQPGLTSPGPAPEQAPGVPGQVTNPAITGQSGSPAGGPPPARTPGLFDNPLLLIFGMVMIFMLMSLFSGRKDKRRRSEMLAGLKRHDRVQTLGGIIGTIVDVKDDELVLRVDETSNTRIRFARSAVQSILRESSVKDGSAQVEGKPAEKAAV